MKKEGGCSVFLKELVCAKLHNSKITIIALLPLLNDTPTGKIGICLKYTKLTPSLSRITILLGDIDKTFTWVLTGVLRQSSASAHTISKAVVSLKDVNVSSASD